MPPPPAGARCAQHPEQAAVDVCQRCGAFVCADCTEIRREDVYCSRCAPLMDRPPSKRVRTVFWLGAGWLPLLGVLLWVGFRTGFGLPFGLATLLTPLEWGVLLALGLQELGARRRGESGPSGRGYLGWGFGFLGLQLASVAGLVLLWRFRLRG